ncbi:MAG: CoA-binding protein [Rhodobacteraceae bacterium]|nr:MAG: CoA-binding protein [Paracoccaceae bacterium]
MTRDLSRLLRPKSIAVFGGAWAENVIEQAQKMRFDGPVWPVHPTREAIHGVQCYRRVEDLPHAPDAAYVGVNRHASVELMAALSRAGAGGAISFASGFAETADGAEVQRRLVEAAGDMPFLGPNCYGFLNYLDGATLWPDQHGGEPVERGVAIVSQSSNMAINLTMQRRGLPLAYVVCAGNQAQTGMPEIGRALAADPRVTALGFYVEGVGDPVAFAAMVAEARELGKPVVAVRAGRSESARAATLTHTASLTGAAAAAAAYFRRIGVALVDTLPRLLDTLHLLHLHGPLPGRDVVSISCSGGEASMMADAAEGRRLRWAPLSPVDRARIGATLNEFVAIANPLDYHTFIWGDEARMTATFTATLETATDAAVFVLDFPRGDRCSDASWARQAIGSMRAAAEATGRPTLIAASLPENMPEHRATELAAAGLCPAFGLDEALAAIEAAADLGAWRAGPPVAAPTPPAPHAPRLLDEAEAKRRLAGFDLAVPEGRVCATPAAVAEAGAALGGRVAVKRLGLAHKTEAGAVALAPADPAAAAAAMGQGPWLVERMVEGAVAELLLGVVRDPAFGLTLTLGAGGVLAEILGDAAALLLPTDAAEIEAALRGLTLFPLLDGYRGRPKAPLGAVVAAALAVARFAEAHAASLEELDVNPLIVTAEGAVAVDALIRIREP